MRVTITYKLLGDNEDQLTITRDYEVDGDKDWQTELEDIMYVFEKINNEIPF